MGVEIAIVMDYSQPHALQGLFAASLHGVFLSLEITPPIDKKIH